MAGVSGTTQGPRMGWVARHGVKRRGLLDHTPARLLHTVDTGGRLRARWMASLHSHRYGTLCVQPSCSGGISSVTRVSHFGHRRWSPGSWSRHT